jgi:hypothetical protein
MKCELCHKKDAETAITAVKNGVEEELYVCADCAKGERARRQKKSHATRKASGPAAGVSMSITQIGGPGDAPPPFLEAIMNAVNGMVGDIASAGREKRKSAESARRYRRVPVSGFPAEFKVRGLLHLEGLFLVNEIEAARRAANALELRLDGVNADGVPDAGHAYSVSHCGMQDRAARFAEALVEQERNARKRLASEMPRIYGDAICRALATLKNCRLLSPGELFDLLSPLRLAAMDGFLENASRKDIEGTMSALDLNSGEDGLDQEERDRVDAERADEVNGRFADTILNEKAEEMFL